MRAVAAAAAAVGVGCDAVLQVRGMFPSITEKQCKFVQADVLGGGASAAAALASDGGAFDLVHDCGLLDSVAMVHHAAAASRI